MEITADTIVRDEETGKWINSDVFRQEAIRFMTTKSYNTDLKKTHSWFDYWNTQLDRCQYGYEVNGHKITGHHYSYLNFSEIEIVTEGNDDESEDEISAMAEKETKCPDFWDGDYDYYWCLEIAKNGLFSKYALATNKEEKAAYRKLPKDLRPEAKQDVLKRLNLRVIPHPDYLDGGQHMIVGKSRRKGYSYKNADICKNVYNTKRNSLTLIGAFDKKYLYPKGTMGMASKYLSFLNKHTAFTKAREYVDRQEHRKASFKETKDGAEVESGYLSEIIALSFGDNPESARGKDAQYVLFEEAGVFPNLKASFNATAPGLTAGRYITGQILIFGTGGDMESGTVDFADMFYNPEQYRLMPFVNIWDENATNSYCGFFHPVYLNMEGFYDKQGNSDVEGAKAYELSVRDKIIKTSTSSNAIQSRVQEYPMNPSEAFLTVSTNDFPVIELRQQFNRIKRDKLHLKYGQPVNLVRKKKPELSNLIIGPDGIIDESQAIYRSGIEIVIDLENKIHPIWDYKAKTKDLTGGVVIFEPPVVNAPKGLYKIGFDPYRQVMGASLAAIYVYKTVKKGDSTRNIIVAQYVGRPYSPDSVNEIAVKLAELYNTEVMHENEVTHVKYYFEKKKKLHLLAAQPDAVISNAIKDSKVARVYGCHMNDKLKDAGEKYIKEWLLTVRDYDENGEAILNLHTLYDTGLIEELILYNRKGNFDRVMAFMQVMFQIEEDSGNIYGEENKYADIAQDFVDLMNKQYSNDN